MAKTGSPRSGSMQFWPRVRAKRMYSRVRSWNRKDSSLAGFAGYKVGMTHVMFTNPRKNALTKGMEVAWPVTIVECPALKVIGINLYKKTVLGLKLSKTIITKSDKFRERKLTRTKKSTENEIDKFNARDYAQIRVLVQTQPHLAGIGKKTPEVFEIGLGGSIDDQYNLAKEKLGKEVSINEVFKEGDLVDSVSITRGKGFQGPVKRFGIRLRAKKSEKSVRNPGSLGPWNAQGHIQYRVAHAGQTGFHQRTELNKMILKISNDPKEVNPLGGFVRHPPVKTTYVLIKGSLGGHKKRLITFTAARRPAKNQLHDPIAVSEISTISQQR